MVHPATEMITIGESAMKAISKSMVVGEPKGLGMFYDVHEPNIEQ
ncbi:hypothetical protein [Sporosarcina sp. P13]|nr:hypothetical protein [Sporosarcina sp. P13]